MPTSELAKILQTIITLKYEIGFMASLTTENQRGHDSANDYNRNHF